MSFVFEYGWIWAIGLAGFLILWPISLWRRDSSIVDFWWGPGFGAMAVALWVAIGMPLDAYTLLILVPLMVWSARLGVQLGLRRLREGTEDPRYQEMRALRSPGWWWKSLLLVFVLQSVLQFLIGAGILAGLALAPTVTAGWFAYGLAAIAILAAIVEAVSDYQLDVYRRTVPHGGLLTTGLRRIVRYPSYTAEIVFWTAMSLLSVGAGIWWAPISAMILALLLRYVSGVTILEDRLARTRPDFAAYQQQVPALVPTFSRRTGGQSTPAE
ncbi:MAG: DUF1295 domain-containing protein [Pseudomonadota bacterium]